MTAVIYARYSSDNQREESIEGQIRECTERKMHRRYRNHNTKMAPKPSVLRTLWPPIRWRKKFAFAKQRKPQWGFWATERSCVSKMEGLRPDKFGFVQLCWTIQIQRFHVRNRWIFFDTALYHSFRKTASLQGGLSVDPSCQPTSVNEDGWRCQLMCVRLLSNFCVILYSFWGMCWLYPKNLCTSIR